MHGTSIIIMGVAIEQQKFSVINCSGFSYAWKKLDSLHSLLKEEHSIPSEWVVPYFPMQQNRPGYEAIAIPRHSL